MKKKITGTLFCTVAAVALVMTSIGATENAQAASLGEQAGTTREQASSEAAATPTFEGPYDIESRDGQAAVAYEVQNNTNDNIYVGLTVEFMNSSNESIGTASAFIPSIAPGESVYIYAVNNSGEKFDYYNTLPVYGTSDYTAATDALSETDITEENDSLTFSFENTSSNAVYLPQVTVVYKLNTNPIAVYSGMLSDGTGELYLDAGSTGTVNIAYPAEYDDYEYYVTALYDTAVNVSNTGTADAAGSTDESDDADATDSEEVEPSTNQADAGQMTLGVPVNNTIDKGEYLWYQFTTDDEDDATYNIICFNETTGSYNIAIQVSDRLGEKIEEGYISDSGNVLAITCSGLSANTTYYIRLQYRDDAWNQGVDSADYEITVEKADE